MIEYRSIRKVLMLAGTAEEPKIRASVATCGRPIAGKSHSRVTFESVQSGVLSWQLKPLIRHEPNA
jgi:hypothetical protein